MRKWMSATIATALLGASLSACAGANDKPENASSPSSEASPAPTVSASNETPADPFGKFDPPIQMSTIYAFDDSSEAMKFLPGESAENNPMQRLFLETMGIDVKAKFVTTYGARDDKLQLAITSHDIPDYAYVNQSKLNQLIRGDMVEDLTDVYEKYASDNLKQVLEQNDKQLFAPAVRDGRIYALPLPTMVYGFTPVLWIRKDWREKLGLPVPETMEQVFDMAKQFAENDPDGNGKKDTLGLPLDKDLTGLNWIMNAYGVAFDTEAAQANMWLKDADGNYFNGSTDPKAKPVYEKLNELYKAGAIDPEFAIKDSAKLNESIASGKLGLSFGRFYTPLSLVDSVRNDPNADWEPIAVPPGEGVDKFVPGVPLNVNGWVYVAKGFEHPEALIKMMNYVSDGYAATWLVEDGPTEFQKIYEETAKDPKYAVKSLNNWMPLQFEGQINWGPEFKKLYDAGDKEGPAGKRADYQRMLQDGIEGWPWKKVYLEGYFHTDYGQVKYSDFNGPPTDTLLKTESILNKEKVQNAVAFIMGAKPLSEFESYVEKYNKLGGTRISEEMKAFDAGQ